ncbi:S-layer homology domain-containing protein [Nitriliruptoraceae bacterium ZYF776]|nr:S-layer homology domain-containing protein [Profundirhabdus halotolerans]
MGPLRTPGIRTDGGTPVSPRHSARLLASALALSLLVAVPASARTADDRGVSARTATSSPGCPDPADPQPAPRFRDIAGSPHEANIDCVARWGIAQGTGDRAYSPRRDVTRAQMATFVANLIRATGTALPEGRDRFPDDDGSPHEPNINALANGGYAPNRNVTRAQAATILAGAFDHVTSQQLPEGRDRFADDDGSPHEANINRLANADIINGLSATRFGHADALKRDQMASLLARFLRRVVGTGSIGAGTVYYSEYGELRALEASDPTRRRLLYEFGSTDTFTVNPHRGEFTYLDDGPAGEYLNEVYVRSLRDNARVTTFRWIDQCRDTAHRRPQSVPLASPDGQWFVAMMDNGWPYNVEIRGRDGRCIFEFGPELVAADSWSWFANGDLLAVVDSRVDPSIPGDWALARFPRQALADGAGTVQTLRTFEGTNPPTQTAISHGQGNIAYIWDRDLYVLDLSTDPSDPAERPHHRVARSSADLMWPAFSPDDRSIILRNRTGSGGIGVPSSGQVHVVANHRGPTTLVEANGPTQLAIPRNRGERPLAFDAKGPFVWTR